MNFLSVEIHARLIGGLALIFIAYSLWMGQRTVDGLPGGYKNPVLALELVKSGSDLDLITRNADARRFISEQLAKDWGYIAIYVLYLCSLALLLLRSSAEMRVAAGFAVVCAIAAGIFDLFENRGMRKALAATQGAATDSLANSIRYPSLTKWALFYFTSILIGSLFLWAEDFRARLSFGFSLFFLLAGIVGILAVVLNLYQQRFNKLFPLANIVLFGIGAVWVVASFLWKPDKILVSLSHMQ